MFLMLSVVINLCPSLPMVDSQSTEQVLREYLQEKRENLRTRKPGQLTTEYLPYLLN